MKRFEITGIVREGKRMGKELGFPTANIAIPQGEEIPENGVYVGTATLADGSVWPCVLNQGDHPTLPEGGASIEAHLLDYEGDLYGSRIGIAYLHRLRGEKRFESVEALKQQVRRDIESTRRWLCEYQNGA